MSAQAARLGGRTGPLAARVLVEFRPDRLVPSLVAGLIAGILHTINAISVASLVFSGDLERYVFAGIGMALSAATVMAVVMALTSSYPGTVTGVQEAPAVILGLLVGSLAAGLGPAPGDETLLPVLVAVIALASALTGAFLLALGQFRLGGLIRYIPYPVIGGFLAGLGWLVVQGAFAVMTGRPLTAANLSSLVQVEAAARWLPGLALAGVLLAATRRFSHALVLPGTLFGAVAGFYLAALLSGTPLAELRAGGWLVGPFPDEGLWRLPDPSALARLDAAALIGQIPTLGTLMLICMIGLLLHASGVELAVRRDMDLNRELRSAGLANVLASLGGGLPGYHAVSLTILGHRMGAPNRLVGLVHAAVLGAALAFGTAVLTLFPRLVVGGLLLFLGLGLLIEWLYRAWFRLPTGDYLVILMILVVAGTRGYLEGVVVGIIAGVILFVVNYSRINVVKHALSGSTYHSNVDRPEPLRRRLQAQGDQIHVLKLQGFLFFGTATQLLNRVRERVTAPGPPLRYAVLDFRLVTGLDSSALLSFAKMRQHAEEHDFTVALTSLSPEVRRQLEQGGFGIDEDPRMRVFPDWDRGLEWCEDQLLGLDPRGAAAEPLEEQLRRALPDPAQAARLMGYLERVAVATGEYLMREGEPSVDLFFVESGTVTVQLERAGQSPLRLRTLGPGTIVGEIALYLGLPRSASVVAESPITAYRLTARALEAMRQRDPTLLAGFHEFVVRRLAERLVETNRLVRAVLD